eukprot:superscaffoldBa00002680_g14979
MPSQISSCPPPALHPSSLPLLHYALICSQIFWRCLPFLACAFVADLQIGPAFTTDLQCGPSHLVIHLVALQSVTGGRPGGWSSSSVATICPAFWSPSIAISAFGSTYRPPT